MTRRNGTAHRSAPVGSHFLDTPPLIASHSTPLLAWGAFYQFRNPGHGLKGVYIC